MSDSHGHDDHGHHGSRFLEHHFESDEQQFDSAKLGIWLFLVTEVLFFSGLFCAYAVYRSNHPEIFYYSHQYLDKWLGAVNTMVLILSSFTIAWGVRAAQLSQKRLLINLLGITLFCAALFMGVKAFEYSEKWYKGLLPPALNEYRAKQTAEGKDVGFLHPGDIWVEVKTGGETKTLRFGHGHAEKKDGGAHVDLHFANRAAACEIIQATTATIGAKTSDEVKKWCAEATGNNHKHFHIDGDGISVDVGVHDDHDHNNLHVELVIKSEGEITIIKDALIHSVQKSLRGLAFVLVVIGLILGIVFCLLVAAKKARPWRTLIAGLLIIIAGTLAGSEGSLVLHHLRHPEPAHHEDITEASIDAAKAEGVGADPMKYATGSDPKSPPEKTLTFFSIYFCLTGLHAFHIIAGMAVIILILIRAVEGHFDSEYFGPVDFVGLYWHLVDLIWIYLFPLLYLIG